MNKQIIRLTYVALGLVAVLVVMTTYWQTWAAAYLEIVAGKDDWQPGRYHYTAELRDDDGRTAQVFTRGQWNWRT